MTRENKLVMVIGFGFLLFLGILVSDHLAASSTPINRDVVGAGYRPVEPVGLPGFPSGYVGAVPQPFPAPEPGRASLPEGGGAPIAQPQVIVLGESGTINGLTPPQGPAKERVHKVAKGEYPSDIAKKYYGKRALGEKLAKYNGIDPSLAPPAPAAEATLFGVEPSVDPMLVGGFGAPAALRPDVPLVDAPVDAPVEVPDEPKVRSFKVREGDTLYKIAKEVLGDASLWERIARENKLGDGRGLKPGMVLSIRLDS